MMQRCFDYIDRNQDRFLQELQQFLRFPSVSGDAGYKEDVKQCALWLTDHLKKLGLDAHCISTRRHPIVRAATRGSASKRVILYGHYDVQPADPLDQWQTNPFEPDLRDGFIYARGATDDKGQLFAHIKAVESLLQTAGRLPCEVLFLLEGEEESGGSSLEEYIQAEKANLTADAVILSDTDMYDENTPALTYGLRGTVALEVKVKTAAFPVHSGSYGGAIGNPVTVLSRLISSCIGPDGRILIPGFYEDVRPLADWEKENIHRLDGRDRNLMAETGVRKTFGEPGFSTLERIWTRPTFEPNGISGGYEGEGMKTIIPACAIAKISLRVVPDQNPEKIAGLVSQYLKSICPDYASLEVTVLSTSWPILFDVDNPMFQAGRKALQCGFGAEPVYMRCGGSIPVVNTFWQELGKPVILMGFGLNSDGAHSTNERFKINNFIRGAKASSALIASLGK